MFGNSNNNIIIAQHTKLNSEGVSGSSSSESLIILLPRRNNRNIYIIVKL